MFKRSLIILAASGLLVGVSAPVFADNSIGFDPYYVLNPNGKEVEQTHASAADALGFDPWYVVGSYEPQRDTQIAGEGESAQMDYAHVDPAFDHQAGA